MAPLAARRGGFPADREISCGNRACSLEYRDSDPVPLLNENVAQAATRLALPMAVDDSSLRQALLDAEAPRRTLLLMRSACFGVRLRRSTACC